MKVIRSLADLSAPFPGAVLTIGNFDGVHLGHRELFRRVVGRARESSGTSIVFTFAPHPRKFLNPAQAPRQIGTDAEKERLIAGCCLDVLICVPFNREMAELAPVQFVREVLVDRIGVRRLVVGYDYAFGRNREGNADFLIDRGEEFGFAVEVLGPVYRDGEVCSSSRIRELIQAGAVASAAKLLGRHFALCGQVVAGAGRGKGLGFPTANLRTEQELLPADGVYAGKVQYRDAVFNAVVNIGCNPTFAGRELSVEAHLLDFSGDLYGETLRLYFIERLRGEQTFSGPDELGRAISADIRQARELLAGAVLHDESDYFDCR